MKDQLDFPLRRFFISSSKSCSTIGANRSLRYSAMLISRIEATILALATRDPASLTRTPNRPNPMPDADDPISLFLTHQDIRVILDDLKAAERRQQHKDAVITFIDDIDVVRERHLFSEHRLRLIETLDKLLWPGPKLPSGGIQEAF
jgi:hypothetical protein